MTLRLGYVAQNYTLGARTGRTFRLANLSEERLTEAALGNVADLFTIMEWNAAYQIPLFRLASGFVSFASHPQCVIPWQDLLREAFSGVGPVARRYGLRLSTHPGQYTVLTSPRAEVVKASLAELEYHGQLFDLLGMGSDSRIILHVGGVHDDREGSKARFVAHARDLSPSVLSRLSVEGDERSYTVSDAIEVARELGIAAIVDNLHHRLNPDGLSLSEALHQARQTWKPEFGPQKAHLSSQNPALQAGAHSDYILEEDFEELASSAPGPLDVMVEAKAKDKAVLALQEKYPDIVKGSQTPPNEDERERR